MLDLRLFLLKCFDGPYKELVIFKDINDCTQIYAFRTNMTTNLHIEYEHLDSSQGCYKIGKCSTIWRLICVLMCIFFVFATYVQVCFGDVGLKNDAQWDGAGIRMCTRNGMYYSFIYKLNIVS